MTSTVLVVILTVGLAAPAFSDSIDPCPASGTVADYEGFANGCFIGDKVFSNFKYKSNPGTFTVADTAVEVTPISGPNIGLRFTGPFDATGFDLADSVLNYEVANINGLPTIDGVTLSMDAESTGLGVAAVDKTGRAGLLLYHLHVPNLITGDQASTSFPPVTSVTVSDDIFVSGNGGSASIHSLENTFSQVPEPRSLGLLTLAITTLGVQLTRLRRSRARH
jgi:hypothetical protein